MCASQYVCPVLTRLRHMGVSNFM
ncbi:hypothetical protein F383_18854 [Gossypium arboreum]|uniref:Uncharacterized protein n=1 Tax=Gossypium arboreum TaxID=29729 RepID=A0A0B0NRZ5_GOSAR|nr:hypothetical protein F383_18854 [Gossypium arboreum]